MVKVTVEHEGKKSEFTGEYFMGFTFSRVVDNNVATMFKSESIAVGKAYTHFLPKNAAACIAEIFRQTYRDSKAYVNALLDAGELLAKHAEEAIADESDRSVTVRHMSMKGEES